MNFRGVATFVLKVQEYQDDASATVIWVWIGLTMSFKPENNPRWKALQGAIIVCYHALQILQFRFHPCDNIIYEPR